MTQTTLFCQHILPHLLGHCADDEIEQSSSGDTNQAAAIRGMQDQQDRPLNIQENTDSASGSGQQDKKEEEEERQ